MKKIEPYLFAHGRADDMIAFYQKALDATLEMRITFGDNPAPPQMPLPTGWDSKVMHAALNIGDLQLMISDGDGTRSPGFTGFRLSLSSDNAADARKAFDALADGGSVEMPLAKTFFSEVFGMLTDKFGVGWMINVVA